MWNAWLTFYYYYYYVSDRRCEQSRSSDSKGQSIKGWNEMIWFGVAMCFFDLSQLAVCLVSGGRHAFFCLGLWPQSNQTWRILPQVFIHVFNLAKNLMTFDSDFFSWFFIWGWVTVRLPRAGVPKHFHATATRTALASGRGPALQTGRQCHKIWKRHIIFSIFFFLLLFAISIIVTFVQNKNTAD